MSLIKCHECGEKVSSQAQACPKCGAKPKQKRKILEIIFGVLVVVVAAAYFFGGGVEKQAAQNLQNIHEQVAQDMIAQYQIAKNHGNAIETCVQAGLVVAGFLQAKQEENHKKWLAVQKTDCKKAGMPM